MQKLTLTSHQIKPHELAKQYSQEIFGGRQHCVANPQLDWNFYLQLLTYSLNTNTNSETDRQGFL